MTFVIYNKGFKMIKRTISKFKNILLRLESDSLSYDDLTRLKIEFELVTVDFIDELQYLNNDYYKKNKDYLDDLKSGSVLFKVIRKNFRDRNIF